MDGWEPTTHYEHDADGRLVSSTPEPEWSEDDRAWMLALAYYRATRCPVHGGDIAECTSEDAEGAYEVPPPTRCHVATALLQAQAGYAETKHPGALLWHAVRRR